jgi:hypothetical protein
MIFGITTSEYGLLGQRMMEAMETFVGRRCDPKVAREIECALGAAIETVRHVVPQLPKATALSYSLRNMMYNGIVWHHGPHFEIVPGQMKADECDVYLGCVLGSALASASAADAGKPAYVDLWVCTRTSQLIALREDASMPGGVRRWQAAYDFVANELSGIRSLEQWQSSKSMELLFAVRLAHGYFAN